MNTVAVRVSSMIATAVGVGLVTWGGTNDAKSIIIAVGGSLVSSYLHLIQTAPKDEKR